MQTIEKPRRAKRKKAAPANIHAYEVPRYRIALVREDSMKAVTAPGLCSPEDVVRFVNPLFETEPRELFVVLAIDTGHKIIGHCVISAGGLESAIVDARAVFQFATAVNAARIILVHNHPSGRTEPSREDIAITNRLARCGEDMGIPVLDHVIWAYGVEGYSFGEHGNLR